MKLPNPFRRGKPRGGVSIPRGQISDRRDGLGARLRELGVPVHDPLADAYRAGQFGSTSSGGGLPMPPHVVAGDEIPPVSKITRAPDLAPLMGGDDGTVWNGVE